jgi:branched-subunit amino acid aminotransferase/4-amino-4-deoxychorismate lyase
MTIALWRARHLTGELTPVVEVDGRKIGEVEGAGPVTQKLQQAYRALTETEGTPLPF